MSLTLTPCQEQVLKDFKKFIRGEPDIFVISGDAGTGKSTLIKEMEKTVEEHNLVMSSLGLNSINEVIKCAPTNHAANLIGGTTIHKAFNIQFSKREGNILGYSNKDFNNSLFIIDEASMISNEIYEMINLRIKNKSHIVFIGDTNQLYPVKESLSKPFTEHSYHKMTTVVRQNNQSDLFKSIQLAKEAIYNPDIIIKANNDVTLIYDESEFKKLIKKEFNDKPSNSQVLVYSNSKVREYQTILGNEKYVYYKNQPIGFRLTSDNDIYTAVPVATIHKAQGRTYPKVYIDYRNISKSSDYRRLLYVALSRASHKAVILV